MKVARSHRLAHGWTVLSKKRLDRRFPQERWMGLDASGEVYRPFADLVSKIAPGRSFADMGCMWRIDGAVAFLAEARGATAVTASDVMDRTPKFDEEHARRRSNVRFVRADMHRLKGEDIGVASSNDVVTSGVDAVGKHDVVWCTGVLYHTPNPLLILANLLAITRRTLVVGNKTIPEIPGVPQAAVFFPGLTRGQREAYAPLWGEGITADYDRTPFREYANWWWGLTPSAMQGFIDATPGFQVADTIELPWNGEDNLLLVVEADDPQNVR